MFYIIILLPCYVHFNFKVDTEDLYNYVYIIDDRERNVKSGNLFLPYLSDNNLLIPKTDSASKCKCGGSMQFLETKGILISRKKRRRVQIGRLALS